MAFQIRDFASIILAMTNRAKATQDKLTDFRVGSVARTLFESPAAEIDELYQQMWIGLKEAIPVATYNSFEFGILPARPSSGIVRVTVGVSTQDITIPSGTVFTPASLSLSFGSTSNVTIPAGETFADIFVSAKTSGVSTNIGSGISFTLSSPPSGFVSAINQGAFTNGSDIESDASRKLRFSAFIATLNHGTVASLKYGLNSTALYDANGMVTEYVKFSTVYEPFAHDIDQPVAWVQCFIHNGASGASAELISKAILVMKGYYADDGTAVPGWKAAGVRVDIGAAENVSVDVTGVVVALPGYSSASLAPLVGAAISEYLTSLGIGEAAIRSELISAAMSIEGVYNFTLSLPAADVAVSYSQKAIPGTVAITP